VNNKSTLKGLSKWRLPKKGYELPTAGFGLEEEEFSKWNYL